MSMAGTLVVDRLRSRQSGSYRLGSSWQTFAEHFGTLLRPRGLKRKRKATDAREWGYYAAVHMPITKEPVRKALYFNILFMFMKLFVASQTCSAYGNFSTICVFVSIFMKLSTRKSARNSFSHSLPRGRSFPSNSYFKLNLVFAHQNIWVQYPKGRSPLMKFFDKE